MSELVQLIKIALFVSWLDLVVCFTPTVHFGKAARIGELVSVWDISFQRCIDDCLARTRCNALLYRPQLNQCTLGSNVIAATDVLTVSGLVLVTGFDEYHRTAHVCGDRACELTETCVEKESGVRQCEVTECDPKTASYDRELQGNVYTVGKKLKLDDRSGLITTCSVAGSWTIEKIGTERIIIGSRDCLSGTSFTSNVIPLPLDSRLVLCDVTTDSGNWLIFQRRFDGSVNFYRDWDDYTNGFGKLSGEFWLGLDELSTVLMSTTQYELRIELEDFQGEKRYAQYSTFFVNDGSDKYRLIVGGYSGSAGDSLGWHNNMQFTTYDRDYDAFSGDNCAVRNKGAWWYNACVSSNLNGIYLHGNGQAVEEAINIIWGIWKGNRYSFKTVEMKIRKKT